MPAAVTRNEIDRQFSVVDIIGAGIPIRDATAETAAVVGEGLDICLRLPPVVTVAVLPKGAEGTGEVVLPNANNLLAVVIVPVVVYALDQIHNSPHVGGVRRSIAVGGTTVYQLFSIIPKPVRMLLSTYWQLIPSAAMPLAIMAIEMRRCWICMFAKDGRLIC